MMPTASKPESCIASLPSKADMRVNVSATANVLELALSIFRTESAAVTLVEQVTCPAAGQLQVLAC
jgi:hypothetical protein